jgi:hypothetical protein
MLVGVMLPCLGSGDPPTTEEPSLASCRAIDVCLLKRQTGERSERGDAKRRRGTERGEAKRTAQANICSLCLGTG